jgi:hypothetical protein
MLADGCNNGIDIQPSEMSVADLRAELKRRGQDDTGLRRVLVSRLRTASENELSGASVLNINKMMSKKVFAVHCKLGAGSMQSCVSMCLAELGFREVSSKKRHDLLFVASWKGCVWIFVNPVDTKKQLHLLSLPTPMAYT